MGIKEIIPLRVADCIMVEDSVPRIKESENATLIQKALSELGESEQRRVETIQTIRQWILTKPSLAHVKIEDHVALAYARGCKYDIKKMQHKIETALKMRATIPEFFSDCDPFRPELQAALAAGSFLPLPDYDSLGRKVIIIRPGCFNPYLRRVEDIEKANFMVSDVMGLEDEQVFITGIVIIIDFDGYSFGHLTRRPLAITMKWLKFLQNAVPISPKKVHFIRTSAPVHWSFSLINRLGFISNKLRQKIEVHGAHFKSLSQEIPLKMLPPEYGGDGLSLAALTEIWKHKIENSLHLHDQMEKFKSDESKCT